MWQEIPGPFREGIDALVVDDEVVAHPELPGVYTLGECVTDHWPDGYSGQGEVRSRVFLHHGSFAALAGAGGEFDWERELWETILHEVLHHREFSASEEGLERYDEAVDQNFRRHAGRPFDPGFYRDVPASEDGTVRIESEIFVETSVAPEAGEAAFGWPRPRAFRWPTLRRPGRRCGRSCPCQGCPIAAPCCFQSCVPSLPDSKLSAHKFPA